MLQPKRAAASKYQILLIQEHHRDPSQHNTSVKLAEEAGFSAHFAYDSHNTKAGGALTLIRRDPTKGTRMPSLSEENITHKSYTIPFGANRARTAGPSAPREVDGLDDPRGPRWLRCG